MSWSHGKVYFVLFSILAFMLLTRFFVLGYLIYLAGLYILAAVSIENVNTVILACLLAPLVVIDFVHILKFFLVGQPTPSFFSKKKNKTVLDSILPANSSVLQHYKHLRSQLMKQEELMVAVRLSISIPLRTCNAYRISEIISNIRMLAFYYAAAIISVILVPVMFTSGNHFVRRRLVIFIDGTIDLALGIVLPFISLLEYQTLLFSSNISLQWDWEEMVQMMAVGEQLHVFNLWEFAMVLVPIAIWHVAYDEVFHSLNRDYIMILEEWNIQQRVTREQQRLNDEEKLVQVKQPKESFAHLKHLRTRGMFFCFMYALVFVLFIVLSRYNQICPDECSIPLAPLFRFTGQCKCYSWRTDCDHLKLYSNETLDKYTRSVVPEDIMMLSFQNCPVIQDSRPSWLRFRHLRFLELMNTNLTAFTLEPTRAYSDFFGLAIINAPLDHVPESLHNLYSWTLWVDISGTQVSQIPDKKWSHVQWLRLKNNSMYQAPSVRIFPLRGLDLSYNPIEDLTEVGLRVNIEVLSANNCSLTSLEPNFEVKYKSLYHLALENNSISELDPKVLETFFNSRGTLKLKGNPICQSNLAPEYTQAFCQYN